MLPRKGKISGRVCAVTCASPCILLEIFDPRCARPFVENGSNLESVATHGEKIELQGWRCFGHCVFFSDMDHEVTCAQCCRCKPPFLGYLPF